MLALQYPLLLTKGLVRRFLDETLGSAHASRMWRHYVEQQQQQQHPPDAHTPASVPSELPFDGGVGTPSAVITAPSPGPWSWGELWDSAAEAMGGGGGGGSGDEPVPAVAPTPHSTVPSCGSAPQAMEPSATPLDTSLRMQVIRMLNDMWGCASFYFASHIVAAGGSLRFYVFQHEPSYLSPMLKHLGAYHGVELDFVFNAPSGATVTAAEVHLAHEVQRLWAEFITGEKKMLLVVTAPSSAGAGAPPAHYMVPDTLPAARDTALHVDQWPRYTNTSRTCVALQQSPLRVVSDCVPKTCALWDNILVHGILRVPPQSQEPLLSVMGNVWAPRALAFVTNNWGDMARAAGSGAVTALVVWAARSWRQRKRPGGGALRWGGGL